LLPQVSAKDILAQLKAQQQAQHPAYGSHRAAAAPPPPPPPPRAAHWDVPAGPGPGALPPHLLSKAVAASHPRYKTVHCRNFLAGKCVFGDRCSFIHDEEHRARQEAGQQQGAGRQQEQQQQQQQYYAYAPLAPQLPQPSPAPAVPAWTSQAPAAQAALRPAAPGAPAFGSSAAAAGPGGLPRTFTGGQQAPLTGAGRERYNAYLRCEAPASWSAGCCAGPAPRRCCTGPSRPGPSCAGSGRAHPHAFDPPPGPAHAHAGSRRSR
jgi:hypothetical protein